MRWCNSTCEMWKHRCRFLFVTLRVASASIWLQDKRSACVLPCARISFALLTTLVSPFWSPENLKSLWVGDSQRRKETRGRARCSSRNNWRCLTGHEAGREFTSETPQCASLVRTAMNASPVESSGGFGRPFPGKTIAAIVPVPCSRVCGSRSGNPTAVRCRQTHPHAHGCRLNPSRTLL